MEVVGLTVTQRRWAWGIGFALFAVVPPLARYLLTAPDVARLAPVEVDADERARALERDFPFPEPKKAPALDPARFRAFLAVREQVLRAAAEGQPIGNSPRQVAASRLLQQKTVAALEAQRMSVTEFLVYEEEAEACLGLGGQGSPTRAANFALVQASAPGATISAGLPFPAIDRGVLVMLSALLLDLGR